MKGKFEIQRLQCPENQPNLDFVRNGRSAHGNSYPGVLIRI